MIKISMEEMAIYRDEMIKMDSWSNDELNMIIEKGRNNPLTDNMDQFRFAYALIKNDFLDEVYSLYHGWFSNIKIKYDKKGDNIYYDYLHENPCIPGRIDIVHTDGCDGGGGGGDDCPDECQECCGFVILAVCLVYCVGGGISELGETYGWSICENCGNWMQDAIKFLCCGLPWNCCKGGCKFLGDAFCNCTSDCQCC